MSKNTVFIIGAGASKEAKLPTGNELKSEISNLLDMRFDEWGDRLISGDRKIVDTLGMYSSRVDGGRGNINPYLKEAWHIRDAMPQAISIDNFLDTQRNNEKMALCGKLAIIRSILEAERKSILFFDRKNVNSNIDFNALESTWYVPFFQLLTENCTKEELNERFKFITLIIFNYDRCVEHYIYHALQNYYKLSKDDAARLLSNINIYHPYGDVGRLLDAQGGTVEFGADPRPHQLLELVDKIKTFTEGTDPESSEIISIREKMGATDRLVFLGFAFHKLNMELITPSNFLKNKYLECFATAKGISESDKLVITKQITDLFEGFISVKTTDSQCNSFFREFWRSLGF